MWVWAVHAADQDLEYPSRPIRMIVPWVAGGGTDIVARVIAAKLGEDLGQQVVVDNRAGANGIVGAELAARSAPDGYTLVLHAVEHVINASTYSKLPYDTLKDFTAIANMVNFPLLLVVHPSLPVKNARELIALAKKNPDQLSYSHPGAGNSGHLAGELFNSMAKVKILSVPYKGTAPAGIALLAGEVQLTFSSIPTVLPHVRAGRLRALGIGNRERIPALAEFPTISETGLPGYEAYAWGGMIGPANMPKDVVARLNKEIVEILKQKDVTERMLAEGTVPTPSSPEEFTAYMKTELKKWGDVVKMANIKSE